MVEKKPTTDQDWAPYKDRIIQWYVTEGQSKNQVVKSLEDNGFIVTYAQLQYRLRDWGLQRFSRKRPNLPNAYAFQPTPAGPSHPTMNYAYYQGGAQQQPQPQPQQQQQSYGTGGISPELLNTDPQLIPDYPQSHADPHAQTDLQHQQQHPQQHQQGEQGYGNQ